MSSRTRLTSPASAFAFSLCGSLLSSAGCGSDGSGLDSADGTDGINISTTNPAETESDDEPTGGPTGSVDDGSDTASDDDASSDSTTGCAEPNACGGCEPLDEVLGESCNGCDELEWTCVGNNALECQGFDPDSDDYYPDEDDDGFGDADHDGVDTCDPPQGWVTNDDDCDDTDPDINPGATEACNGQDDDCDGDIDEGESEFCEDVCCSFELACDGTECAPKCPGGNDICGADLDECCVGGEVCYADSCVVPGGDCEFTEECAIDEICAPSLGECIPDDAVPLCEFVPPPGSFDPQIGCRWTVGAEINPSHNDVVASPIVINLTDDNADGFTDKNDTPDIAFLTYDYEGDGCCTEASTLRIASGDCNGDGTMTTLASIDTPVLTNDTGIAAADLDGDGVPEIVAVTLEGGNSAEGTVAFKRDTDDGSSWSQYWLNTDYPEWDTHTRGGATISIADVDANGTPEIIIGNVVLNGQTGAEIWDGDDTSGGTGGVGNNGFLGPSSAVADIDQDGLMEIIAGNTVYEDDGTVKTGWPFTYSSSNSPCGGSLTCDGFTAVANFDADDDGEIVIVRLGEVFLIDTDGTEIDKVALPTIDCSFNESGPPTIADFDGDGLPEVGTASADYMVVVDFECTALTPGCDSDGILWKVTNQDCTSRVTASSVFDFEGDGAAEVVYADETSFRIFDGATGTVEFDDTTHGSHTRIEMPVIADVDNDGNAEIVIPENGWGGGTPGVEIWEDASDNWVRTRRVWNQHGYHITHITEDGDVPTTPEVNWLNERFNNYRQNVQPDGLFHAPDAVLDGHICAVTDAGGGEYTMDLSILVRNNGAIVVPAGTTVRVQVDDGVSWIDVVDTATTIDLQPGQFEVVPVSATVPAGIAPPFSVRAIVDPPNGGSANGEINECIEDNNSMDTVCAQPS